LTFADLFADYIERHAKPNKKTWEEDLDKYERHIAGTLGRKPLSMIIRGDVAAIHAAITRTGKGTTANRVLALISSVFGRAVEWSVMEANPAKGIRRNKEQARDRFLQSDELPRFFAALAEEESDVARDYFLLSLITSARLSNVLAMRWTDVNLAEGLWRIPETKNGTPQNVPLTQEAIAILNERRRKAAPEAVHVLAGRGKTGHYAEPRKGWERIIERGAYRHFESTICAERWARGKPRPAPHSRSSARVSTTRTTPPPAFTPDSTWTPCARA
jgi:integrase